MLTSKLRRFGEITRNHGPMMALAQAAYHGNLPFLHRWFVHTYWGFDANPNHSLKYVHVQVDEVNKNERFPFSVSGENAVMGVGKGKWDLMVANFTELRIFQSIKMKYEDGVDWEDTPQYEYALNRLNPTESVWNSCYTEEDLKRRCDRIDQLYKDIKEHGYKSNLEEDWNRELRGVPVPDELRLAIDRNGELIRCGGARHRLSIAKILDLDQIPALVQVEHEFWSGDIDIVERIPTDEGN